MLVMNMDGPGTVHSLGCWPTWCSYSRKFVRLDSQLRRKRESNTIIERSIPCRKFNFQIGIQGSPSAKPPREFRVNFAPGLVLWPQLVLTRASCGRTLAQMREEQDVSGETEFHPVCMRSLSRQANIGRKRTLALITVCHFELCGSLF